MTTLRTGIRSYLTLCCAGLPGMSSRFAACFCFSVSVFRGWILNWVPNGGYRITLIVVCTAPPR